MADLNTTVPRPDTDTIRDLVQMAVESAAAPIHTNAVADLLRGDRIYQSDVYRALATLERRGVIERRRDLMEHRGRAQVVWQMTPLDLDHPEASRA